MSLVSQKILCEWCKNKFSNERSLLYHQKSAKYCLKLQGKQKKDLKCEWCKKNYVTNFVLNRHKNICSKRKDTEFRQTKNKLKDENKKLKNMNIKSNEQNNKLKDENNKLKDENERLKNEDEKLKDDNHKLKNENDKLKDDSEKLKDEIISLEKLIANKEGKYEGVKEGIQIAPPTNTTNKIKNYINPKLLKITTDTIRPFTVETIKEDVKSNKYTESMFLKGLKGLVDFIFNIVTLRDVDGKAIEQSYACTDVSRNRFHRFLDSKEWSEDNGAYFLKNVFREIREPVKGYFSKYVNERRFAKNESDREYYDNIVKETEIIYQGVMFDKGDDHLNLFNRSRNMLKSMVSV